MTDNVVVEQCSHCDLIGISKGELKQLVKEAVREEIHDEMRAEFVAIGILAENAAQKMEMQEDFSFIRSLRKTGKSIVNKVGSAVVIAVLGVMGTLLVVGFRAELGK
jgi:hypothetical protein